jgi:hypothetical protein
MTSSLTLTVSTRGGKTADVARDLITLAERVGVAVRTTVDCGEGARSYPMTAAPGMQVDEIIQTLKAAFAQRNLPMPELLGPSR